MSVLPLLPRVQTGFRLFDGATLNGMIDKINSLVQWPGNVYYCDPSQAGNGTGSIDNPYNSLVSAYNACVAGNNDVVVLVGDGSTTATARLSSTLTWAKNATHLIGVTAPSLFAQRARISTATGATTNLAPLMSITASGCIFSNFSFFQGVGETSTAEKLLDITGSRNYFGGIQFGGMGGVDGAAHASSYCIGFGAGGSENLFDGCAIGLETRARSAANASLKILAANAQRNAFRRCVFQMYPTANSPLFLNANVSNGLNGSTWLFDECDFQALMGAAGSTQPSVTCTVAADVNGTIFFSNCRTVAAKWAAATTNVKVMGFATAATTGFNSGVYASAADS